jgi:hypothetical protein
MARHFLWSADFYFIAKIEFRHNHSIFVPITDTLTIPFHFRNKGCWGHNSDCCVFSDRINSFTLCLFFGRTSHFGSGRRFESSGSSIKNILRSRFWMLAVFVFSTLFLRLCWLLSIRCFPWSVVTELRNDEYRTFLVLPISGKMYWCSFGWICPKGTAA